MEDLASLSGPVIIGFFALGVLIERLFPGRPLPRSPGWYLRGGIAFVSTMAINALLPALVADATTDIAPFQLSKLGTLQGALVAFIVLDLATYVLHRLQHRIPALWRWTHQAHHSAERLDTLGAAYFHPFDIALQALVAACITALLGVSASAAALAGMAGVALAVFQHVNVRTPMWLGFFVQRPENHSVHHQRGVHAYNYGNLTIWDQLLGTFRNPAGFAAEAGFYDGASARVGAMLLGRDVSEPEVGQRSAQAVPQRSVA